MANRRTAYYYMSIDERILYHREKQREYRERIALIKGRTIRHIDPDSHPTKMSYEERLEYNRECLRRHKERQKQIQI